jgi:hypothetical protein
MFQKEKGPVREEAIVSRRAEGQGFERFEETKISSVELPSDADAQAAAPVAATPAADVETIAIETAHAHEVAVQVNNV